MAKSNSRVSAPARNGASVQRAALGLRRRTPLRPTLAILLGSGFNGVCERVRVACSIPYTQLPGFPRVSIEGHAGRLLVGHLRQTPVLLLCGRAHYYEGHTLEAVTFPVRVLAEFGVRAMLLTNAAGGINPRFRPGDFMGLADHINFMGANPLRGRPAPGATQFVDLTDTYDPTLLQLLKRAARNARVTLHSGTYLAVTGPTYETPAEIRAFARLGADAIGMSTVPEAIVARQCGLAVAGLSCITNPAAGLGPGKLSHSDVLRTAAGAAKAAARLLEAFAGQYAQA